MEVLGWDVHSRWGEAPAYRDVIKEDRVKVGGGTKAPNYGFYAGGERRFIDCVSQAGESKRKFYDSNSATASARTVRMRRAWTDNFALP